MVFKHIDYFKNWDCGFLSCPHHKLAVSPWVNYLILPSLSFLICKVEIIDIPFLKTYLLRYKSHTVIHLLKIYNSLFSSTFTHLCNYHHKLNISVFYKRKSKPINCHFLSPLISLDKPSQMCKFVIKKWL